METEVEVYTRRGESGPAPASASGPDGCELGPVLQMKFTHFTQKVMEQMKCQGYAEP
jgi:hypothetical protein